MSAASPPGHAWRLVLAPSSSSTRSTKALVRAGIELGEEDSILPALKLVHVRNKGVAFGALSAAGLVVVVVVAVALVALLSYFVTHADRPLIWLPTGLLLGGAIGNIIDRIRDGAVTDFVKLPAWPAFNVADIAITFGVLALLFVIERGDPMRLTVPPSDAGRALDALLAEPLGSRSRAQRLIDGRRGARRRASRAPSATRSPAASGRGRRSPREPAAPVRRPARPATFGVALRGRAPAGRRQARRASSCIPRAGTAAARCPGAGRTCGRRRGRVAGRASCTASTATRRGLLVVAKSEAVAPRAEGRAAGPRRSRASTSRSSRAARRRAAGTIDAPIGRDRRVRTRMSTDTDEPRARSPTSRSSGRCRRRRCCASRWRPGAPTRSASHLQAIGHPVCGDPEYGDGRRCWASSASSCTPRAWPSPIR